MSGGYYEDPYELLGWQGEEFDAIGLIDGAAPASAPVPQVTAEEGGLLRSAAFYAGQVGLGALVASTVAATGPFAVPAALAIGYVSESGMGGDNVQKVADLLAFPGQIARNAMDAILK